VDDHSGYEDRLPNIEAIKNWHSAGLVPEQLTDISGKVMKGINSLQDVVPLDIALQYNIQESLDIEELYKAAIMPELANEYVGWDNGHSIVNFVNAGVTPEFASFCGEINKALGIDVFVDPNVMSLHDFGADPESINEYLELRTHHKIMSGHDVFRLMETGVNPATAQKWFNLNETYNSTLTGREIADLISSGVTYSIVETQAKEQMAARAVGG
ncbi:hypothetical protein ACFL1B_01985, partial [Nanoarchaeota archaeon]